MYIHITAVLKEPQLPIDYRRLVISLIKASLLNSDMAAHQRLYATNTPVLKSYSFSVRMSNPEYTSDRIILDDNKITIRLSTSDMSDGITLFNAFLQYKNTPHPLANGNELTIKKVDVSNHEPIKANEVLIKFLSPLVVREHRINVPDRYYIYDDEGFANVLNEVVAFQLKTLANITGDEAAVTLIPVRPGKTVAKALGCNIRCSLGVYRLIAKPKVLNTLYQTGMGSRRAAGFGQFDIILAHLNAAKAGKKRCIECYGMASETKSISFLLDTADDVVRKKSYYWNQKPDAFVCPLCAFLYTLVPLGFEFLGEDAVFVNNNSDIKKLYIMMNTYRERKADEKTSFKSRVFGAFTAQKADMLGKKIGNIQVVVRSRRKSHFQFNIIDADMIRNLQKGAKYLERLERKYVKDKDEYIAVYGEVLDNFLLRRSQYGLLNKLLKIHLGDNTDCSYMMNIVHLEVIFRGGDDMEAIKKNADSAWRSGKNMRDLLTSEVSEKDADNSLRGFVYKLTNALSVGNRDEFLDSIIRVYSGKGLPIPYVFRECIESEDMFRAIGYGYILGLKYSPYQNKDKKEETYDD